MTGTVTATMTAQEATEMLRKDQARFIPFLFTEFFGGQVLQLPAHEVSSAHGLHDLILIDESGGVVSDEQLRKIGQLSTAGLYLPRPSDLADGILTKADYDEYRSLGIRLTNPLSDDDLEQYFSYEVADRKSASKKPAIFLDRDGTIIELVPYVKDPAFVKLMDGVTDFLKRAQDRGYLLVCVTNQSGLGRGYYDLGEFQSVQGRMYELLAEKGIRLDGSFFAGHFAESNDLIWAGRPSLRKPRSGMLIEAARRLNIDLESSIMIGDSLVDMQVAGAAGLKKAFQILGEKGIALDHFDSKGERVESFSEIILK